MSNITDHIPRKELMHSIGKEAEEEVYRKLSYVFGDRNVSCGVDGFSIGTGGYPDVSFIYSDNLFYVEVKSIIPFTKRYNKKGVYNRTNAVKLNKDSWKRLKKRAKERIATILMIVEVRLIGDNDYFLLDYDMLEDLWLDNKDNEWLNIPLHFIMMKCRKLVFRESEFLPHPIDTPQSSLNKSLTK